MDVPVLVGLIGAAGAAIGALVTAVSKKWRTPTDEREDNKAAIEANERLLARFEAALSKRDERLDKLETQVDELKQERNALVNFVYHLVEIIRALGGMHLIHSVPSGIRIFSTPPQTEDAPP